VRTSIGDWSKRAPLVESTIRTERPDVVAFQEIEQMQLGFASFDGYRAESGEPTGISDHPRQLKRIAPVALLLWGLVWLWLGPPPWTFWETALHAVLFAFAVLAPLLLFVLVRYRGPFRPPGEFVPIAWRADRLDRLAGGTVWFSDTPAKPTSMFPLLFEPRVAHWARFRSLADGTEFLFVNAHLGHAPWHYAGSARVLLELIARERPAPDAPVFLVGDFNALPQAGVIRRLRTKLRDAWSNAEAREGPETTFQWNLAPGMTPLRLDHVLFAGPVRPVLARVLTPRQDGKTVSDHDPVVVDFEAD
jgi:endonuclease/exonuclease/phosphatase family metal-dependent hydrolase